MSATDISLKKVFKILGYGLIVTALGFLYLWSTLDLVWLTALKGGVGFGVTWVVANLADAGMVMPQLEGLRK